MNDPKAKRRVAATKRCTKLSTNEGDGYENVTQKNEFVLLQTLRLFHLVQFVKCCQFLLEINS